MRTDDFAIHLGQLVMEFQRLENELREILWFCEAPNGGTAGPARTHRFCDVVFRARQVVTAHLRASGGNDDDTAILERALDGCMRVAKRRNDLLHSTYATYGRSDGGSLFARTNIRRTSTATVRIDHEEMTEHSLTPVFADIRETFDLLWRLHRRMMYDITLLGNRRSDVSVAGLESRHA